MGMIHAAFALSLLVQARERIPVPPEKEREATREEVRRLFSDDYASRDRDSRARLSKKLLKSAIETTGDPTARYVLFTEAIDTAAEGGDTATALEAASQLEKAFAVDGVALRKEALSSLGRSARTPSGAAVVAREWLTLVDLALASNDYDAASDAVSEGATAARRARDAGLVAAFRDKKKEIDGILREYRKVRSAHLKLKTNPDDPGANLEVGTFLCAVRGDWGAALPLLARCSDKTLANLASRDLEEPAEAAGQLALGEGWWARAGEERDRDLKAALARRARFWIELAKDDLSTLKRLMAEKRLEEIAPVAGTGAGTGRGGRADLMSWIDVERNAVEDGGRWELQDGRLTSAMDGTIRYARLMVPCVPPAEYDLELTVRPRDDADAIFFVGLVGGGRQFTVALGESAVAIGTFADLAGKPLADRHPRQRLFHPQGVLSPDRDTTLTCSVRRNRFTLRVDGRPVLDWQSPPWAQATVERDFSVPNPSCLFLATRDRTVYTVGRLAITTFSGPPRRLSR